MSIVLVLLAIGSVFAGYIGVPAAVGGGNQIEHFLAPSFATPGVDAELTTVSAAGEAPVLSEHSVAGESKGEGGREDRGTELGLMAFSSGIALAGIGIAAYFFLRRRDAAAALAARFAGVHRLLLNKYYVDEMYDAAIVQPIKRTSERGLWKVVDAGVIDGAVNGAGSFVDLAGAVLRRLQTGSMRAYALSIFVGVVVILGYYVWR